MARVVEFEDLFYGLIERTAKKWQNMIENFDNGVYGQEVTVYVTLEPWYAAARFVCRLQLHNGRVRGPI